MRNLSTNKLYFHCEECERGFDNPNALDVQHSFLALTADFEAVGASKADINSYGWTKYAVYEINE